MNIAAPISLPVIETARLRLREQREGDANALLAVYGDPRAMAYWSGPPWTDIAQAHAHLQRAQRDLESGGVLPWAIADIASDELIGTLTLFKLDRDHRRAEIGYILGTPHWGKGLAGEAMRAVLRHAFGAMQLERIEADTDPRNAPSLRMLERLGFKREGLLRKRWFVNDEWCDSAWLGLLREDFTEASA